MSVAKRRRRTMTVRELINELLSFEPSDWVTIDGKNLRISSEVCDSLVMIDEAQDDGNA
jgi:hypothetical protein